MSKEIKKRILEKILTDSKGCWVWQGAKFATGKPHGAYGQLRFGKKVKRAHRVSYEAFIGKISEKAELDHLCKNTLCVNPQHLEPVSHLINMGRSKHATKTHCKHGHEYTEKNLYINPKGSRECRICRELRAIKFKST